MAADDREKTTYSHHRLYFFTWFNTEFEPHLLEFSLFSFFFTQTLFFFKTYQCNTKFMWCSYKFFLEPKKRHSSMCSRMVGLLIRTEKPNSGPKQHCCLPTPLSRTIQNIAVVATCGHCGPTYLPKYCPKNSLEFKPSEDYMINIQKVSMSIYWIDNI